MAVKAACCSLFYTQRYGISRSLIKQYAPFSTTEPCALFDKNMFLICQKRKLYAQRIGNLTMMKNKLQNDSLDISNATKTDLWVKFPHGTRKLESQYKGYKGTIDSMLQKNLRTFGFTNINKTALNLIGTKLYVCCAEYSNYPVMFKKLKLDDTFQTWFDVRLLYCWMLMVRLNNHRTRWPKDVRYLLFSVSKAFWTDVEKRVKKIATGKKSTEGLSNLYDRMTGANYGYDEGLLSDDKVLAGALWRNLFNESEDPDPKKLASMVAFVHRNLLHLKSQSDEQIFSGYVTFLPLQIDKPDLSKDKQVLEMIMKMG